MLLSDQRVNAQRGFSLVEVMVALVITAIGLLGLAKMESLALSSTTVSSWRSLMALEAGSMAAYMHANRGYWSSTSATAGVTITGTAPSVTLIAGGGSDPVLSAAGAGYTCYNSAPCSVGAMAAHDVQAWGSTVYNMVPNYSATIACTPAATTPVPTPVTCQISLTWSEATVAVNSQQTGITQGTFTLTQQPTYTLFVQP